jgi:hypothetical protein
MPERRKYTKKTGSYVVAVQVALDTDGFVYRKWGANQTCKARDWLVNNEGDTYTVDCDVFHSTYRRVSPGVYEKVSPVWAEVADRAGVIHTKEGLSHYQAGAYLVYNEANGQDGYPVDAAMFEKMYEPDREGSSREP